MTTPHRDLAAPELWDRSLERSRRRRRLAAQARKEIARRKQLSTAVATAMFAGQGTPLAMAQAGGLPKPGAAADETTVAVRAGGLPLMLGSEGELVAQVQRALRIEADGVFGPLTESAVRRFQYASRLQVDGIVGPDTWAALFGGGVAARSSGESGSVKPAMARAVVAAAAAVGGERVTPRVRRQLERELRAPRRVDGDYFKHPSRRGSQRHSGDRSDSAGGGGFTLERVVVGSCGSARIAAPVRGRVTSGFGPRWGRNHDGVDIAAPSGTPVRASACGIVTIRGWVGGYGNMVCIAHTSRFATCYAHLSRYSAHRGERVRQGELIGYVGCTGSCTGPHVHFETRVDGRARNPRTYLSGAGMPGKPRAERRRASSSSPSSTYARSSTTEGDTYPAGGPAEDGSRSGTTRSGSTGQSGSTQPAYGYGGTAQGSGGTAAPASTAEGTAAPSGSQDTATGPASSAPESSAPSGGSAEAAPNGSSPSGPAAPQQEPAPPVEAEPAPEPNQNGAPAQGTAGPPPQAPAPTQPAEAESGTAVTQGSGKTGAAGAASGAPGASSEATAGAGTPPGADVTAEEEAGRRAGG